MKNRKRGRIFFSLRNKYFTQRNIALFNNSRRAVDSPTQSRYGQKRRAHMDEEGLGCILMKRGGELSGDQRGQSSSTYWQRQLFKAEETDSDRYLGPQPYLFYFSK